MTEQQLKVSVVIVNYNRRDDLRAALTSVKRQEYANVETIVVDNCSTDGSREMLRSEFPDVRLIENERNTGMAGYTTACEAATGYILFQMDNDSLMPTTDVLSKVVAAFASIPQDVAILACRVFEYREGRDSIAELLATAPGDAPTPADGYHAGGVAFRKEILDKSGYYNEDVFLYGAELFVQTQVIEAGYRIMYAPHILMLHKASPVTRSPKGVFFEVRNRIWFMRRYGSPMQLAVYLPQMMFHDFFYSFHRKAFRQLRSAWWEGYGRLPLSLGMRSKMPSSAVREAVKKAGASMALCSLARRAYAQISR